MRQAAASFTSRRDFSSALTKRAVMPAANIRTKQAAIVFHRSFIDTPGLRRPAGRVRFSLRTLRKGSPNSALWDFGLETQNLKTQRAQRTARRNRREFTTDDTE